MGERRGWGGGAGAEGVGGVWWRRENKQNLSASILTSYFAIVYKVFFFSVLRLNLEYPDE